MPRSVSLEKKRKYDELKRFFAHWETHLTPCRIFELSHPHNPLNVLAALERDLGVSQALAGLEQAVNDALESCDDLAPDEVARADASLAAVGAPTLTQLWQRRSRQYKALLRRGHLRSDTEFYLATSILSDTTIEVSPQDRESLGAMVATYESRQT
jgi:hypothetical protein